MWQKLFWLIAFVGAVIMAIYFINNLFINYDQTPVIVGFNPEMVNVNDIPFPAITMCNVNVALKRRAIAVNTNGTSAERSVLADLCDSNQTTTEKGESISWTLMQDIITNVTQRCNEMLIACKWQSKMHRCDNLINSVITDDGYGCSFNKLPLSYSLRDDTESSNLDFPSDIVNWNAEDGYPSSASENTYPYRAYGRGVEQGLTLVMNAELDQYYCSSTSSIGFKLVFATPLDSPKIADLGFLIPPGIETRITIKVQISDADENVRGIHWSKRKCFYAMERYLKFYRMYSARNCLLECEANYTHQMCGCLTFDMPRDLNAKICDKGDDSCVSTARFKIERFGDAKAACNCLPGCFEIDYRPEVISVGKLDELYDIIDSELIGNVTREYFAKNVAIVHFYYAVDKFQKQTKSVLYSFSEFLSNTGGLLGLFMGFSFLSVVEIFYFLFMKSVCKWGHNKLSSKETHLQFVE